MSLTVNRVDHCSGKSTCATIDTLSAICALSALSDGWASAIIEGIRFSRRRALSGSVSGSISSSGSYGVDVNYDLTLADQIHIAVNKHECQK